MKNLFRQGQYDMRIALCDDDKQEQAELLEALQGLCPAREVECFTSGQELLVAAKELPAFNIIFLDIYMPKENGVDIAREVRTISPQTEIVFVTTSKEFAVEAFSLHALHYIVKPIKAKDVKEVFYRLAKASKKQEAIIKVVVGRETRKLRQSEICRLQSVNHKVEILLKTGEIVSIWTALSEVEGKLDDNFLKIQRGTIVNMGYIKQMNIRECILKDGTRALLSRGERMKIKETYDEFIFSQLLELEGYDVEER